MLTTADPVVPGFFDGDWWLQYGFDGAVGAGVAAGIAIWVLRRTLRSEREQSEETLKHERLQAGETLKHEREQLERTFAHDRAQVRMATSRAIARDLLLAIVDLVTLLEAGEPTRTEVIGPFRRTLALADGLQGETVQDWPVFSAWVGKLGSNVRNWAPWGPPAGGTTLRASLWDLEHTVRTWLLNPDGYEPNARPRVQSPRGEVL